MVISSLLNFSILRKKEDRWVWEQAVSSGHCLLSPVKQMPKRSLRADLFKHFFKG